ncbi:MAG: NPCBM/NEW2 domain-containing protein [Planctomycetota bacterium]
MNAIVLFAVCAFAASPEMELRTLDGELHVGAIVELTQDSVVVESAGERKQIDLEQVLSIEAQLRPQPSAQRPAPSAWVDLVDGSALVATRYHVASGKAQLTLLDDLTVEIPTREIAAVRLASAAEPAMTEWQRIAALKSDGDVLVIRKEEAIDYLRGVFHDVTDTAVEFDLDGEKIPVKRTKVFGLIYYHATRDDLPPTVSSLVDSAGNRWSVHAVSLTDKGLAWTTPAGVKVERGWESVEQFDFSGGKVVYLSDLKPESIRWTPYFGRAEDVPAVAEFYAPRMDQTLSSQPLVLEGKSYSKGIALHSRTEIVFRLPDRFSWLKGNAGIDDRYHPNGNLQLVIRGDDRVLLDASITGKGPAVPIELDLSGVRRLTIVADFGKDLDVADHLLLCNLRFVK